MPTLTCPVRGCQEPLERIERRYACPRRHSFDLARSGYLNLLQPQDRRSSNPGDSAEAATARRALLEAGEGDAHLAGMVELLRGRGESLLDVGCGDGWYTEGLRRALGIAASGVDISLPSIERAARSYPECTWIVANADRRLPWADRSFDILTSITARLHRDEFDRLLAPGGVLLVVLTAADDLVELREAIGGERIERDRVERTVEMFAPHFALAARSRTARRSNFTREQIDFLLASTYRGARHRERERLEAVTAMEITLSRDLLLFERAATRTA